MSNKACWGRGRRQLFCKCWIITKKTPQKKGDSFPLRNNHVCSLLEFEVESGTSHLWSVYSHLMAIFFFQSKNSHKATFSFNHVTKMISLLGKKFFLGSHVLILITSGSRLFGNFWKSKNLWFGISKISQQRTSISFQFFSNNPNRTDRFTKEPAVL